MSSSQSPLEGYTRGKVPLKVLQTAITASAASPLSGFLEIFTEDGLLRLSISADAAADLRIDLDQFLAAS